MPFVNTPGNIFPAACKQEQDSAIYTLVSNKGDKLPYTAVVPAKAGIQFFIHKGNATWIPAFAGMTDRVI